jgi:YVTN family beta-propeller protein
MAQLRPGAEFAGHRIEGVAGRGGMGVVYRATHLALDHVVALKVISPDLAADDVFRERFRSESRIAASIRHPNVVPIHHAGEEDGLMFVTMDFIEGTDLRGRLNEKKQLDPEEASSIVSDVASALDAAHSRGLVHRDVKPGNVLLEERGGKRHVYLTDFGLTKQIGSSSGVTASGAFVGTLDYVAPEQIKGDDVDARADIYALGCVLYEMLSGWAPFSNREEKVAKIYAHLQDEPDSLLKARPELSPAFEQVVLRAMAKDPDLRQPSAGDLARGAEAAMHGDLLTKGEHSVAVGAAAPTRTHEVPADVATVASEGATPSELETAPAAEARPEEPPPAPVPKRERRSPLPLLLGLGAAAIIIVAIVLALGGGGGDDTGAAGGKDKDGQKKAEEPKGPPSLKLGSAVKLGGQPVGVAVIDDPSLKLNRLLVANQSAKQLDAMDVEGKGLQRLTVGATPRATDAGDQNVWVVNTGDGTVSQFRQASLDFRQALQVGSSPQDVAVGNHAIWVSNADGTISRITPSTSGVQSIPVDGSPYGMAADPLSDNVFFTDRGAESVRKLDPGSNTVTEEVPVGKDPSGVAIDSTGAAWVAVTGESLLKRVDGGKVVAKVPVGKGPRDVAIGLGSVWVTCGDGTVVQVDPETADVVSKTRVKGDPQGIDVSDSANAVWVALSDKGELARIDVQ